MDGKTVEQKILQYVFIKGRVEMEELENRFKLEKIDLLKIIFELQNRHFLYISDEDQSIKINDMIYFFIYYISFTLYLFSLY